MIRLLVALLALVLAAPALAQEPDLFGWFDAHPVPGTDAWCLDSGHHLHEYAMDPEQEPIYVMDGVTYYMGDVVLTGAPIEAVWYWGAHPVGHLGGAWCVLDGPHAHYWRPWWRVSAWSSGSWQVRDGYWTWVGPYDDWYHWSHGRWYSRHTAFHVRYSTQPRYAPRYVDVRHPAVVYVATSRSYPSWDARRSGDRYRSSRTIEVRPSRDSRYGRRR